MNSEILLDSTPPVALDSPVEYGRPLPVWLIPSMLGALVAISIVIVMTGWGVMTAMMPKPELQRIRSIEPTVLAQSSKSPKPCAVVDSTTVAEEEPPVTHEMPRPMVPLQRRPAVHQAPSHDTLAPPMLDLTTETPNEPAPKTQLQRGLRWQPDVQGSAAQRLIMPIEIARNDEAAIPHSIRRLKLSEPASRLKLAVTPVHHDDLGSILTKMGPGYEYTQLQNEDLMSLDMLKKHDVVFVTCADQYVRDFRAVRPLRDFVAQGGTLYASDLRGDLLQAAFPEFRAMGPVYHGIPQTIDARIVDPGLRAHMGRRVIPLNFEAPDWRPVPFDPGRTTVCLSGMYRNNLGQVMSVPLLVKFRFQKGTVIFTSFHHTKNDSETVRKLLDYLVFAAVNARNEARVKDLMQRSQFSPSEMRATVLNVGKPFEGVHNHAAGGLQIAVGFDAAGAKLKLALRSPNSQLIEYTDHGLYLIEVPQAAAGQWCFTVTPLELPYANFPIVIAVGSAKS